MKVKLKTLIIILSIIAIVVIAVIFAIINPNKKQIETVEKNISAYEDTNTEKENTMIVSIGKKEEQKTDEQEEQISEPVIDAATLTQAIYDMNTEIGTLYIPKTGLTTSVYCRVTVEQMETMPCFLYTTGGLSKKGVTLFVGHNRRNGKLFSDNKMLEEGDEFYFTDYEGTKLKYKIYSKFITTEGDISFLDDDVDVPVIALSCCTDANDENRIIILGKAE